MSDRRFVHLHCHSHYSLLDGASRIPELVAQVKAQGMNAIALTDHGNLYGAIELYRECTAASINPIIGYEAYISPTKRTDRSGKRGDAAYHLTLLAMNETGFKNLVKLSSIAFLEGYYYVPRIDKELLEAHSEGLFCLSGCLAGEFNEFLVKGETQKAEEVAFWFQKVFQDRYFIEIQNNGMDIQDACTVEAVRIAERTGVPLVATADAHYLTQEAAAAHDVLICINTGAKRSDEKRLRYGDNSRFPNPYYVRSPQDMYQLFPGHADAVARSQEIADRVNLKLDFKKRHFPVFHPPEGLTVEQYFRQLCEEGIRIRYGENPRPEVMARFEHECGIITRMNFSSYFLIVWDFVRFAREQGIPCSARGSGCGSLVCYVMFLSHVDPLQYDLLFERFLDPNRSEAPDIDIDFCQDRRELVIEYVKQKYGRESVAQIATFGTMAAKAAIKDVGRVLDIPLERVNYMTKLVPTYLGASIDDALKEAPDFRKEYDTDPQVREWINIARELEGTNRNAGTHAAGVVIANGPITNYVPVHRVIRKGDDGNKQGEVVITTQWVMGDIEKVGMLKMDFLGLRTLTLVDHALRMIKKTRGITIDPYQDIPIDDAETYKLLQRGEAKGVFQFESEGIRELLKRMKPDNIRDIIACTALYRPGPLEGGMVDEYIDCKHGRKQPTYHHPIMEEVLGETFAVMCYQEQVMRLLNRLGGIELSSAYACIKAISKKKQEIIDARKGDFIKGASDKGMDPEKAREIFELIEKFGGYGFNKSHSAAYAYVSYHTAYLKRHYTPEFMAALLSSEIDDGNKRDMLVDHIADARKFGVPVLPPDVNQGESDFTVVDSKIVFGLTAIKGLGRGAAEEIVRARTEGGPFRDMYDFCDRVDLKIVSRAAIERMIKAGAFDRFANPFGHRAQIMMVLPRAIQSATERQQDRKRGQRSFFDILDPGSDASGGGSAATEALPEVPYWSNTEKLMFEKEALDFYLSSHPLAEFDADLRRYTTHECKQLIDLPDGKDVRIGGMITQLRYFTSKRGNRYARCKIEDFTGSAECVMWSDELERFKDGMVSDRICLAEATVEFGDRSEPVMVLKKLMSLDQAKKDLTKGLVLKMTLGVHAPEVIEGVARVLRRTPGPCQVYMLIRDGMGKEARLQLGKQYNVNPAELKTDELEMLLGPGSLIFSGRG
ncbi:DNA polymerase III subunit alpha [Tuwongella immobilis]|uniref:DNA polymerase III subunit alpha n=1 Tax=Tuwongella immobilis TaxID=692036 RepID=A0A6C2YVC3_9BACT|nr:DNA polymerase III subunit alpha [Tuwongella immobilis]VIP05446.1 dna polymerase iii subunit alpha : DNA-directed DNA polymerase OS=Isosphaera pallida (strain ATCC 43644 / DSM 9630 / IS1B) GN=Isop_1325 PE=4 SV=1: PHP: DNA_pol3_alpha: HHH_6 [Tuwongella immobilis]VTS08248.1 dna polymerase iii subunit alpha : DNA-directed DNA polymerase OS=Isosphaera pallida (strain ATCC 43644 / DSM 9630 / IS1B) GN=Isop_1325 PE=4 SV=1: PHP: DNA_pol3_alpha: HHH_6 [Tuwongella immobilis]